MRIGVHAIAAITSWSEVFDEAEAKRPTAVLVALELHNRSLGCFGAVEPDDTRATRAATGLILNLRLFHVADG